MAPERAAEPPIQSPREPGSVSGLLVDWGGVMTTNLFNSFTAFCEAEQLDPDAVSKAFRGNRE